MRLQLLSLDLPRALSYSLLPPSLASLDPSFPPPLPIVLPPPSHACVSLQQLFELCQRVRVPDACPQPLQIGASATSS
eukprot:3770325-Rhodomonas_salina.1